MSITTDELLRAQRTVAVTRVITQARAAVATWIDPRMSTQEKSDELIRLCAAVTVLDAALRSDEALP